MKTHLAQTVLLLTLAGAMLAVVPAVVVAAPSTDRGQAQAVEQGNDSASATPTIEQQRAALTARLVEKGADRQRAELAVGQLNTDDVQVLYQNPDMMQAAGDLSDEEAILICFGVVIVVLLIIIAV